MNRSEIHYSGNSAFHHTVAYFLRENIGNSDYSDFNTVFSTESLYLCYRLYGYPVFGAPVYGRVVVKRRYDV